jgi:septal ring factor EnvC (AmiA/AmiB activator)
MEGFFSSAIGGGTVVGVIAGILVLIGLFDKKKRAREKEVNEGVDGQEDRLIQLLKDTESELNKKMAQQKSDSDSLTGILTKKVDDLTTKVDHLEKENAILTKVLQGRDEQTQTFYKKAFEIFVLIEGMSKTQTDLMRILSNHLKPTTVTVNNNPTQPTI